MYISSKAVDGRIGNLLVYGTCSRTKWQRPAKWTVELPGVYHVKEVVVTGRADCCCKFQILPTVWKKAKACLLHVQSSSFDKGVVNLKFY